MRNVFLFLKDESGSTAVEYGLVAVGISIAVLAVVNSISGTINEKMTYIASKLGN
jgi:pilus assembly protein Flp/PilA